MIQRYQLSPEILAKVARLRAIKPRRVQRAEHQARMLAAMEQRHRESGLVLRLDSGAVLPPPPKGVSGIRGGTNGA